MSGWVIIALGLLPWVILVAMFALMPAKAVLITLAVPLVALTAFCVLAGGD